MLLMPSKYKTNIFQYSEVVNMLSLSITNKSRNFKKQNQILFCQRKISQNSRFSHYLQHNKCILEGVYTHEPLKNSFVSIILGPVLLIHIKWGYLTSESTCPPDNQT